MSFKNKDICPVCTNVFRNDKMIERMKSNPECQTKLKDYYDEVITCIKCGRKFGRDKTYQAKIKEDENESG